MFKYTINLKSKDDKEQELDDRVLVKTIYSVLKLSEKINLDEYQPDEKKYALFRKTAYDVARALGDRYSVNVSVSTNGFVGSISVKCKEFIPYDVDLFKGAVANADSIEFSATLSGEIDVCLSFFNMLKRTMDWSKN